MNYSDVVKRRLWEIVEDMKKCPWLFSKNPDKDFQRKKKWDLESMMKFMLTMEGRSMKEELYKFFEYSDNLPSNSAFNQRREQLLPEAFEFLFHEFTESFSAKMKTYCGYRLLACDGSDLNIARNPDDPDTYFQSLPNDKGFNQLHLNALYDLNSRCYIDAIIQPGRCENEAKAMCSMIDRYSGIEKTIFIADRGYENYNIFAHAERKGMNYLIRVKDVYSNGITSACDLPDSEEFDVRLSLTLTRKQTKEVKENPQKYRIIMKATPFDYLDLYTNKYYDITMRILRFEISEGKFECIITNLPEEEFNIKEIKELYHKRWGIETSFRELKYAVGMTCFHARKVDYIKQEIWARLVLYNFCEIITTQVSIEKKNTKYDYQLNYTIAIHICRYFLSIKPNKVPPDVETLISKELLPVRPGRHDPRKVKPQSTVSFLYRAA
ncbi:IS4 family transposase [Parasporobacterium paucivorans]|uniref:Transposase DDE domain-containing protein n=1 Tax=Parasporobacterium paucivorans DSM 15970 TaxID=1122934 RepID=A0A1M6KHP3_9FIRM|nr:IS4 family transposase [Parasporobacterium paucivorans]SHJ58422.1 Transposase DDE domain-containing protein [Parasporobacterium paucivorans DSM 15970]